MTKYRYEYCNGCAYHSSEADLYSWPFANKCVNKELMNADLYEKYVEGPDTERPFLRWGFPIRVIRVLMLSNINLNKIAKCKLLQTRVRLRNE